MTFKILLAASMLSFVIACGSDSANNGVAPQISNLVITPASFDANQEVDLKTSVDFADPDGDVRSLETVWTFSDNTGTHELPLVSDVSGTTNGKTSGTASITEPTASSTSGDTTFEVWVIDAKGHESNHLSQQVTIK